MSFDIINSFFEPFWTYRPDSYRDGVYVQKRSRKKQTCKTEVFESFLMTLQVVVNPESLVVFVEGSKFAQERKIFTRVLNTRLTSYSQPHALW